MPSPKPRASPSWFNMSVAEVFVQPNYLHIFVRSTFNSMGVGKIKGATLVVHDPFILTANSNPGGPNEDFSIKRSMGNSGKYVSVHLWFEEDMVSFYGCAYDGADAGKCYGKRAGFSNGDGGKRDHPCWSLVCRSGTDYAYESKREDADRGNWGTQTDELVTVAGGISCLFYTLLMNLIEMFKTHVQASSALDFIEIMSKLPHLEIRRLYMGPIPARVEQFWSHGS